MILRWARGLLRGMVFRAYGNRAVLRGLIATPWDNILRGPRPEPARCHLSWRHAASHGRGPELASNVSLLDGVRSRTRSAAGEERGALAACNSSAIGSIDWEAASQAQVRRGRALEGCTSSPQTAWRREGFDSPNPRFEGRRRHETGSGLELSPGRDIRRLPLGPAMPRPGMRLNRPL